MADQWKLDEKIAKLKALRTSLPQDLARYGQRFFQQEFNKEDWNGVAWAQRKVVTKRNEGKHLLVASGRLRQSLQNTVRHADWKYIEWGTDVPYAKYQNYGTDTIPARKFLGDSHELRKLIKDKIILAFNKALHK